MRTREELTTMLTGLGADPGDVDVIISDVQKLIVAQAFIRFVPSLTEDLQGKMKDLRPEQILDYLKQHAGEFPGLSASEIEKITEETWSGYLKRFEKVQA